MIRVKVVYRLWLRDKTKVSEEIFELTKSMDLLELISKIIDKYPHLTKLIGDIFRKDNPIIINVNGVAVSKNVKLKNGDKVTLIPPVSGG